MLSWGGGAGTVLIAVFRTIDNEQTQDFTDFGKFFLKTKGFLPDVG